MRSTPRSVPLAAAILSVPLAVAAISPPAAAAATPVRAPGGPGTLSHFDLARNGRYRIVADYLTDPSRDAVVVHVRLVTAAALSLYVRLDASVNGNGGGGAPNGGADDALVDPATGALVSVDANTTTNAGNRT